ncbi:MAG: hypothetical protein KGH95_06815, partial [Thaumarchaeota archaeon]|nr:hypothetical protein [Nitrososphaerota archaeon]
DVHFCFMLYVIKWYTALGVSLFAVMRRTKNGYLVAGIISWGTLVFCLLDNWDTVFHHSLIFASPNYIMTGRNFATSAVSALAILGSHNSFHKIS